MILQTPENDLSLPSPITDSRLLRSSQSLGWQDIEVETYLEPSEADCWVEPVSPDITVVMLTQGATQLTESDRASCKGFQLRAGDSLLKPASSITPALRWQTVSDAPVQTLRLSIPYALFSRMIEELADRDPVRFSLCALAGIQDPVLYHIGLRLKHELETPSSTSVLYAQTAAHLLTVHLLHTYATKRIVIQERQDGLSPRQLRQITDYIQTYLTNALSLEELAQQIGFSPYHFARLFRQAFGESPHQFVIRQRVEYAKRLLSNPAMPLTQVAIESGFADQSHLTQTFKRHTGLTPKAFRQNH